MAEIWTCANDKSHTFATPTADFFCDKCPPFAGILIKGAIPIPEPKPPINGQIDKVEVPIVEPVQQFQSKSEVGLCILLMDASGSMFEKPFEGSPLTRMQLASNSAAQGIFDLQDLQNNQKDNAYIAAFKFDHRVELMFFESVGGLMKKHNSDHKKFASYLYEELHKMGGGTNINGALEAAHNLSKQFVNKTMPHLNDYELMEQTVRVKGEGSKVVPNVRTLIYTDGGHWVKEDPNLKPSPFKNVTPEIPVDILMGAYFGEESGQGCSDLKGLLGNCPKHGDLQFLLFDDPSKYGTLRHLFKMASGGSGFCLKCVEEYQKSFGGENY